jgi:uncharacterized protein YqeY
MGLFEQINTDIKNAMLAKEKEKLEALRAVKAAFMVAKTEKGNSELTEDKEIQIVQKLVKQRLDTAEVYKQNNRPELAEKEEAEAKIIAVYLPKQLSEDEITAEVKAIIEQTGASSMKDMGKVMGMASKKLAGKADGKIISGIVKQMLG